MTILSLDVAADQRIENSPHFDSSTSLTQWTKIIQEASSSDQPVHHTPLVTTTCSPLYVSLSDFLLSTCQPTLTPVSSFNRQAVKLIQAERS